MAFLKPARSVETVNEIGYHRCDLELKVAGISTKSWLFRDKSPVTADWTQYRINDCSIDNSALALGFGSMGLGKTLQ